MNERIRELAEQAGGIRYNDDNEEMTPMLIDKQLEKFAELLIKHYKNSMQVAWYKQGLDVRGADISKYFTEVEDNFNQKK